MKNERSRLGIRVYGIDGSTQTFTQEDPSLINGTLADLHPALLFTQDRITIADDCSQRSFVPPLITRIDLVTDRLSVWDFPFVLGALVELTEAEFMDGIRVLGEQKRGSPSEVPVYLDLEMLDGRHSFLWMQVIAGLPAVRFGKIYAVLKERRLVFGLSTHGVGILNLANLVRFSAYPEPLESAQATSAAREEVETEQQDTHSLNFSA